MSKIFSDLFNNAQAFDAGGPDDQRWGTNRAIVRELNGIRDLLNDPGYTPGFDGTDEVQSLAVYDGVVDGGTFTLTVTLANGQTFTTDNIAFDADDDGIQLAIDTAADGEVTGYSAGDISVSGGDLTSDPVVFTFGGDSVDNANHPLIVVDDALLTGGGGAGDVTQITAGQAARTAWAVLFAASVFAGTLPEQGEAPAAVVDAKGFQAGPNPNRLTPDTIRALCLQASIEDQRDALYGELLAIVGISQ